MIFSPAKMVLALALASGVQATETADASYFFANALYERQDPGV